MSLRLPVCESVCLSLCANDLQKRNTFARKQFGVVLNSIRGSERNSGDSREKDLCCLIGFSRRRGNSYSELNGGEIPVPDKADLRH